MGEILNSTSSPAETKERLLDMLIDTSTQLTKEEKWTLPLNEEPMAECVHNFKMLNMKVTLMVLHMHLGAPHIAWAIRSASMEVAEGFTETMTNVRRCYEESRIEADVNSARTILETFEPQMADIRTLLHAASMDTRWQMLENQILRAQFLLAAYMELDHETIFIELVKILNVQIKFTAESSMLFRNFYAEWNLYYAVRKYWACNKQAHVDYHLDCISDVFPRTKKMHEPMLALFGKCKAQLLCKNSSRHMQTIMDDMQAKLNLYESGNPLPENRVFLRLPPT